MRKTIFAALAAIILPLLLPSCKTTQENYQKAYEITKAKRDAGLTEEELNGIAREEAMPKTVYNGDSIPLNSKYVKVEASPTGLRAARRYTVVVGSMRQLFNAKSLYNRMIEAGYNDAILLADAQKTYYIGALTTSSLDSAVTLLRTISEPSKAPVPMKAPFPYILRNPSVH